MSILEIGHEMRIQIPDKDGIHKTPLGKIGVEILQWGTGGTPKRIKLESDLLRGTPKKNWWRRKRVRVVDLGINGIGMQRMSKREVLIVRPDDPELVYIPPRDHDWY